LNGGVFGLDVDVVVVTVVVGVKKGIVVVGLFWNY
jgi:hypothetical protein